MTILNLNLRCNFKAWGQYLPGQPIDNLTIMEAQAKYLGKKRLSPMILDAGIRRRFGHHHRHWVRKPWEALSSASATSEDLALEAVKRLEMKTAPSCFVHGTTTSSRYTSSQAAAIAGRMGWQVPAFEIKAGCSSSLVSLMTAFSHLHAGYPDAVVACAETLSKVLSREEPDSWFGLSDAGAALHIVKEPKGLFEVKKVYFKTFGEHVNLFTTPGTFPPTQDQLTRDAYTMVGDADLMKTKAYEHYEKMLMEFLPDPEERKSIDYIIPHQVNQQMIVKLKKQFALGGEFWWIADRFGNPGGAATLLALVTALAEGFFAKKSSGRILLLSVGGGLSCAAQLIDFHRS